MTPRCENCLYWRKYGNDLNVNQGYCCRRAPRLRASATAERGVFPKTESDEWCGEWAEKESPRAEIHDTTDYDS
jgi:hypothetical protein